MLGVFIDQVKCVEDDNSENPEKLHEETLAKVLRQLKIMYELSLECREVLRKLDVDAYRHKKRDKPQ